MDDDGFSWIVVLAVVAGLVYLFVVYVLPWVLLLGAIIGLPGWALSRLLISQRVQLTRRSALWLFLANGMIAWIISSVVVESVQVPVPLAAVAGASAFLVGGLVLVVGWAAVRWFSVQTKVAQLVHAESEARMELQRLEAQAALLEQEVSNAGVTCLQQQASRQALEEELTAVCTQEPRILGAVRHSWSARLRTATSEEVLEQLGAYQDKTPSPSTRVAIILMELEMLLRKGKAADEDAGRLEEQLALARGQLDAASVRLKRASSARQRSEKARRGFAQRPILL